MRMRLGFQNPDLISDHFLTLTKICNFPVTFSDLASNIHTNFQTWSLESTPVFRLSDQMFKISILYQMKTAQNHTLLCCKYLYRLYRGVPPPPPPQGKRGRELNFSFLHLHSSIHLVSRLDYQPLFRKMSPRSPGPGGAAEIEPIWYPIFV